MNPPPLQLNIQEVYMLLGEKDIIIYQLGEQFNKISAEKIELEKRIAELENGKLGRADKHLGLLDGPEFSQSGIGRRGDALSGYPDESAGRSNEMEPVDKSVRGMVGKRMVP